MIDAWIDEIDAEVSTREHRWEQEVTRMHARTVCEVYERVVHVRLCLAVRHRTEPREPEPRHKRPQRPVARDHHVYPEVELLTSDEKRVLDVPGDDVRLGLFVFGFAFLGGFPPRVRSVFGVVPCKTQSSYGQTVREQKSKLTVAPFLDLRQLVDEEDALALCFAYRFHDPRPVRRASELLHEQGVVGR